MVRIMLEVHWNFFYHGFITSSLRIPDSYCARQEQSNDDRKLRNLPSVEKMLNSSVVLSGLSGVGGGGVAPYPVA